jgi:hypothetical protein
MQGDGGVSGRDLIYFVASRWHGNEMVSAGTEL